MKYVLSAVTLAATLAFGGIASAEVVETNCLSCQKPDGHHHHAPKPIGFKQTISLGGGALNQGAGLVAFESPDPGDGIEVEQGSLIEKTGFSKFEGGVTFAGSPCVGCKADGQEVKATGLAQAGELVTSQAFQKVTADGGTWKNVLGNSGTATGVAKLEWGAQTTPVFKQQPGS